jgi:hypothetical protein
MVLNTEKSHLIQTKQPRTTMQDTIKKRKRKTPHAYNQKEKNSNQPSQNYYYSHFYLKSKQTRPSGAVRTAKRTEEALRQIFKAIITIC